MELKELFEAQVADNQWINAKGRLVYEPTREFRDDSGNVTVKGHKRTDSPWWLIATVDPGILAFYRNQVSRHILNPLNLPKAPKIHPPMWGGHITILDGRTEVQPKYRSLWKAYQNQYIDFQYSPNVVQKWKFWVLPVRAPLFSRIRAELGLNPNYNFHITVGRMD